MGPAHAERAAAWLLDALGVELPDGLLGLALTHRSFAYENGGLPTNERLEFLGDSVLGLVVTDELYRSQPTLPEGQLAKLRASVVNMTSLAGVARRLGDGGIGPHLLLGRGEETTGGRDKDSILADALEALIGAVHLGCGLDAASTLVHRLFDPLLAESATRGAGLDWKTSLQELGAARGLGVPELPRRGRRPRPRQDVHRGRPPRRHRPRPRLGPDQEGRRAGGGRGRLAGAVGPVPRAEPCPNSPRSRSSAGAWSSGSPAAPSRPSRCTTRAPSAGTSRAPTTSWPP